MAEVEEFDPFAPSMDSYDDEARAFIEGGGDPIEAAWMSRRLRAKGLLDEARRARSEGEIAGVFGKVRGLGEKWGDRTGVKERKLLGSEVTAMDLVRKGPVELDAGESGLIAPADVIGPYYGDGFGREVLKAMLYNDGKNFVPPEAYGKLFDEVRVNNAKVGAFYSIPDRTVVLPNKESNDIEVDNFKVLKEWEADASDPEYQKKAFNYYDNNEFNSLDEMMASGSALEHELGHHYTARGDFNSFVDKQGTDSDKLNEGLIAGVDSHLRWADEAIQGMSRLQREMYKNTGSRIEKPDDFIKMVKSGKPPEFLSPEAKRIFNYAKKLIKKSESEFENKYRKEMLDGISKGLPSVVKNEDFDPFA